MSSRRSILSTLLLVALSGGARSAQAGDLPPRNTALLILRALAYDRKIKARAGAEVRVLVLYQSGNQPSEATKSDLVGALEDAARETTVAGLPVRVTSLAYSDAGGLDAALKSDHIAAVYVCLGVTSHASSIAEVSRRRAVLSFSGDEDSVKSSLSIGLITRGTKPTVLVNLMASKAEGADLDPALLRVAEVNR